MQWNGLERGAHLGEKGFLSHPPTHKLSRPSPWPPRASLVASWHGALGELREPPSGPLGRAREEVGDGNGDGDREAGGPTTTTTPAGRGSPPEGAAGTGRTGPVEPSFPREETWGPRRGAGGVGCGGLVRATPDPTTWGASGARAGPATCPGKVRPGRAPWMDACAPPGGSTWVGDCAQHPAGSPSPHLPWPWPSGFPSKLFLGRGAFPRSPGEPLRPQRPPTGAERSWQGGLLFFVFFFSPQKRLAHVSRVWQGRDSGRRAGADTYVPQGAG